MANDLTVNPIIVDTAGATALITQQLHIYSITWGVDGGTASDAMAVTDQNSKEIVSGAIVGADDLKQIRYPDNDPLSVSGLIVPTLASGKLYIHVKEKPPYTTP